MSFNLQSNNLITNNKTDDTIENTKLKKIKQRVVDQLLSSTAHGLPNILRTKLLFIKLTWFTFIIVSACFGSYFIIDNILDYLKYNTITTISVIKEQQAEFPSISFCGHPNINTSLEETVMSVRYDNIYEKNFSKVFNAFNDSVYGKCFRFNSGRNTLGQKLDILNSTSSGKPNGLTIKLYLKVPEQYDYAEILLSIHNHSSPSLEFENGAFWVKPGSWNYYEIERTVYERLGEPYSDCLKDVRQFKKDKTIINYILNSNRIYSQEDCHYLCSNLYALEKSGCGCRSSLNNFGKDCIRQFFEPAGNDTKQCVAEYLKEFRNFKYWKCIDYCPTVCDSMSYTINPYFEHFPTNGKISAKSKKENGWDMFDTYEQVNKHSISIYVYYKDLKYTLISNKPKTEFFTIISNMGGTLGLFLGISFLSFIEIFEILFHICHIVFFE
jgi:hypothetical protein